MYQNYFSRKTQRMNTQFHSTEDQYNVIAIKPTIWEEHCLECSAPDCFRTCPHYVKRNDGRCQRFVNSIESFQIDSDPLNESALVEFKKWGNLMSLIYPSLLSYKSINSIKKINNLFNIVLRTMSFSKLPTNIKWFFIRSMEYLRRRLFLLPRTQVEGINAYILELISHSEEAFNMIFEVYNGYSDMLVYKTAFPIRPGHNQYILKDKDMIMVCNIAGNKVKVYPEYDFPARVEFLKNDFVKLMETKTDYVKCVVWDLDNTLWEGILIETENSNDLRIREKVLETIIELDKRGILQSISSKNDHDQAIKVLKNLGIEQYFLYPEISWNPKSSSIQRIADQLNIGIDTFAFIDDSEFERQEVLTKHSKIRVFKESEIHSILNRPEFNPIITVDSRNRRQSYQQEEKRNQIKSSFGDELEFIKSCSISITLFTPVKSSDKERCFELLLRSNQLNLSGRKYNRYQFDEMFNQSKQINLAFSSKDKFGVYGIVNFASFLIENNQLIFKEFAMSCRVAGKYIESAYFTYLKEYYHVNEILFPLEITEKNKLLRNVLESIGAKVLNQNEREIIYSLGGLLNNSDLVEVAMLGDQND